MVPMCQPLLQISFLSGRCNSWPIFRAFARYFSIDAPDWCINRRARLCERGQRAENSGIAYTAFFSATAVAHEATPEHLHSDGIIT